MSEQPPTREAYAELIKERDNRYWIGASSEAQARFWAGRYGIVLRSRWAGPGHYRSDVYIVEIQERGMV